MEPVMILMATIPEVSIPPECIEMVTNMDLREPIFWASGWMGMI